MTEEIKHTEASVLRLLRERHAPKRGANGPEWAYVEQVRNAAGFGATRTADAMALSLWPSRGHELHGFEVKVSRADWRTELSKPEKAEAWTGIVDRWWVVAPKGVVPKDELPATWGLMEVNAKGDKLTVTVQAPLLSEKRHDIKRSFLVPLLRAAGAGPSCTPEQAALDAAREEGWHKGFDEAERSGGNYRQLYEDERKRGEDDRRAVRQITEALKVDFGSWYRVDDKEVQAICRAIRAVVHGEKEHPRLAGRMRSAALQLERLHADLERTAEALEKAEP